MAQDPKVHRFTDCKGFHWRYNEEMRASRVTKSTVHVTCGACKQRILDVLLSKDWRKLNMETHIILDTLVGDVHLQCLYDESVEAVQSSGNEG